MNSRRVVSDIVCLVLLFSFTYMGLIKLVKFDMFQDWVTRGILIHKAPTVFAYVIPGTELAIGISFCIRRWRTASLYIALLSELIFFLYVFLLERNPVDRYFPFNGVFLRLTWPQEIGYNIVFAAVIAGELILTELYPGKKLKETNTKKILRNQPANVN